VLMMRLSEPPARVHQEPDTHFIHTNSVNVDDHLSTVSGNQLSCPGSSAAGVPDEVGGQTIPAPRIIAGLHALGVGQGQTSQDWQVENVGSVTSPLYMKFPQGPPQMQFEPQLSPSGGVRASHASPQTQPASRRPAAPR
jgi:hypothetical protein